MRADPAFRPRLVIFAKAPRLGRVKTRLARDIGHVQAWRFYRVMLFSLARRMGRDPRFETLIACAPDTALFDNGVWPRGVARIAQGRGNLGERMQRVFDALPPGPVVIIGADIPEIRPADIADAFRALGRRDAVFGPAGDGGYWLVGLKRRPVTRQIFAGVRWSGPHALADTVSNLQNASYTALKTLNDVDNGKDFRRFSETKQL
ncbi:TIGR04282 family arsenosugar biosynthesis glycosyltransferase [Thalassospiraceae bacterium LMO-JJ14]|nr:TIGR04282 family arsenosugar biosynthesis glycosyltransferase [Thalassospiraceae bacterium LMO-JJ14]